MKWYWYLIGLSVLGIFWLAWEIHRAPTMPDDYDEERYKNV
jgi:hypothetical protein